MVDPSFTIISYVSAQWFTLITGAEGYPTEFIQSFLVVQCLFDSFVSFALPLTWIAHRIVSYQPHNLCRSCAKVKIITYCTKCIKYAENSWKLNKLIANERKWDCDSLKWDVAWFLLRCNFVVVSKIKINIVNFIWLWPIIYGSHFWSILCWTNQSAHSNRMPTLKLTMYRNDGEKKNQQLCRL